MYEPNLPEPELAEGLTGGAAWRGRALRVVQSASASRSTSSAAAVHAASHAPSHTATHTATHTPSHAPAQMAMAATATAPRAATPVTPAYRAPAPQAVATFAPTTAASPFEYPAATAPAHPKTSNPGRASLRPDRTFAQHGLLGAPDALVVRVGVESVGSGAFDIEVAFAVPDIRDSVVCESSAGWYEPSGGWEYSVRCHDGRAIVVLSHHGYLLAGDVAEATFRMTLAKRVDLSNGLLVRTSARTQESEGTQAHDLIVPVERLSL